MAGIDFAHFANGKSGEMTNISDLVLVNVETSAVNVGHLLLQPRWRHRIAADSLVDMTGDSGGHRGRRSHGVHRRNPGRNDGFDEWRRRIGDWIRESVLHGPHRRCPALRYLR